MKKLNKEFFERNADDVAKELLGKVLVFNSGLLKKRLRAKIVETEAYFDENDPASRAVSNGDLRATMKMGAGTILVYGVHNNWLLNVVTGFEGGASAVLIRALEPINFEGNCSGPGRLTKVLGIDKLLHKKILGVEIFIEDSEIISEEEIGKSHRIGVTKDLKEKMRFYIKGNKFVSGSSRY